MTKKSEAFDLGSLNTVDACNTPTEIEIKHPTTGAPTGVFFSVLGRDSDVYRSRIRSMADESLRKQATGKAQPETLDSLEKRNTEALVAATTGWRTGDEPTVTLSGEKLAFSADNARKVYEQLFPVRDQVAEAIADLGNFLRS